MHLTTPLNSAQDRSYQLAARFAAELSLHPCTALVYRDRSGFYHVAEATSFATEYALWTEATRQTLAPQVVAMYAAGRLINAEPVALTPATERPAFVEAYPHLREAHRRAQCAFYGAASNAGLDTNDRDAMIAACNYELSINIASRRELTIEEMEHMAMLFDLGLYTAGWIRQNPAAIAA